MDHLEKHLLDGLKAIDLPADTDITLLSNQLLRYIALITKWNDTHNLTAVRNPASMITHHMLDSLTSLPYINGPNIVDVGSGAGLPGIPLALVRSDWQVTLVESSQKKAAFLVQAAVELNLPNVSVRQQRVENMIMENNVDTVISRAFSNLNRFMQLTGHLCRNNSDHCRFIAMKGAFPDMELMQLSPEFHIKQIIPVTVPGLRAKRHLIVISHNQDNR
jgi:16S rRNA (guanine527-N7)-methyltransferase